MVVKWRYQLKGSKKDQSYKLKGMAFYYRFTGVPTWIWPSSKTMTKIWNPTIMCLIHKLFYLLYSTFISNFIGRENLKRFIPCFFFEWNLDRSNFCLVSIPSYQINGGLYQYFIHFCACQVPPLFENVNFFLISSVYQVESLHLHESSV